MWDKKDDENLRNIKPVIINLFNVSTPFNYGVKGNLKVKEERVKINIYIRAKRGNLKILDLTVFKHFDWMANKWKFIKLRRRKKPLYLWEKNYCNWQPIGIREINQLVFGMVPIGLIWFVIGFISHASHIFTVYIICT